MDASQASVKSGLSPSLIVRAHPLKLSNPVRLPRGEDESGGGRSCSSKPRCLAVIWRHDVARVPGLSPLFVPLRRADRIRGSGVNPKFMSALCRHNRLPLIHHPKQFGRLPSVPRRYGWGIHENAPGSVADVADRCFGCGRTALGGGAARTNGSSRRRGARGEGGGEAGLRHQLGELSGCDTEAAELAARAVQWVTGKAEAVDLPAQWEGSGPFCEESLGVNPIPLLMVRSG